jgi:hypothetical protein
VVAVAAAGVLVVGAHAASAAVIQICKSNANGMSGRTFMYQVTPTGGTSFGVGPVTAGRCSGPITVPAGSVTVTEDQSVPATDVEKIVVFPFSRKLSEDTATRRVSVNTGATETQITFFNQPSGGTSGTLKICKLTQTPAFLGRQFSFSVNGGPLLSTEANDAFDDPANWICRVFGSFQVGSLVRVQEQIPAGVEVDFIDTDPGANLEDFNTDAGWADVRITPGTTIVLYDDEPVAPSGTGFIEVCKNFGNPDPDVTGPFNFTITDSAGANYSATVNSGLCSPAIEIAAGIATVTETQRTGFTLVDVQTNPQDRLLDANLINRTATVEVPTSASQNDETQVFFTNAANRGQLKVCKALGPGSADLNQQVFSFTASGSNGQVVVFDITAVYPLTGPYTPAVATQCRIVGNFPIGSTVNVTENLDHSPNAPGEFIDTTGEGPVVIANGVNNVTITNTARGLLEVCKTRIAEFARLTTQPTFQFRIDGGAIFTVRAGTCSLPRRVSVGNHTVTEVASDDYEVYSIGVSPPDREISTSPATRTAVVSVPYGGNETVVTYVNRVRTGQVKVCKTIPITSQDSLGPKDWTFDVYIQTGPGAMDYSVTTLGPIKAGECTSFTGLIPVLTPQGTKRAIGVHENDPAGLVRGVDYDTTSITTTGTRGLCKVTDPGVNTTVCPYATGMNLATGDIDFYLGPGPNTVTYANRSLDP